MSARSLPVYLSPVPSHVQEARDNYFDATMRHFELERACKEAWIALGARVITEASQFPGAEHIVGHGISHAHQSNDKELDALEEVKENARHAFYESAWRDFDNDTGPSYNAFYVAELIAIDNIRHAYYHKKYNRC